MVRFLLVCLTCILYTLIVIVVWVKVSPYIPQIVHQSTKVVLGEKTVVKPQQKHQVSKFNHPTVQKSR